MGQITKVQNLVNTCQPVGKEAVSALLSEIPNWYNSYGEELAVSRNTAHTVYPSAQQSHFLESTLKIYLQLNETKYAQGY